MKILESYYIKKGKTVPYYAKYSLLTLIWRPFRKYCNVVLAPNIPFTGFRVWFYRNIVGYKIGKNVFIGMKCYLDDLEPKNTIIESGVTISYGCYFSLHGKGQTRTSILIKAGAYLGMRCNVVAGKNGITIGENSIIGAGSLVIKDVKPNTTVVGVPAKT